MSGSTPNAIIARSPWRSKSMKNSTGVSSRRAPDRCYTSLTFNGTVFAAPTSSTIIESKRYSSGQKNMLARIDGITDSSTVHTSQWSKRRPRSELPRRAFSRSHRMGACGGKARFRGCCRPFSSQLVAPLMCTARAALLMNVSKTEVEGC